MSERERPEREISTFEELRTLLLPLGAVAGLALLLAAASMLVSAMGAGRPIGVPEAPVPTVHEATERPTRAPEPSSPSPTQRPELRAVHAVRLIDVDAGSILTLYKSSDNEVFFAGFDETQPGVAIGFWEGRPGSETSQTLVRFTLQGTEIQRGEWTGVPWRRGPACRDPRWTQETGPVEVDGEPYEDVRCGPISPDGRWMTYEVPLGEDSLAGWDQWAVDLETKERRLLQEGLRHCGGCDSRFGPTWSASGRYLYFSDLVSDGRIFLSDLQEGTTREIVSGSADSRYEPEWSPVSDVLLYPGSDLRTVLEDLQAGSAIVLEGLPWPAAFDPTGGYVYSPAWGDLPPSAGGSTAIYHIGTGRIVASLPGQPRLLRGPIGGPMRSYTTPAVVGVEGGFVAALEGASGCGGTAIYSEAAITTCVAGATEPQISPDGTKVAVGREVGGAVYEILVIDVATGAELMVIDATLAGDGFSGPIGHARPIWNAEGTHLLVWGPLLETP
ncbi:MAG: hypothetical protein ACRDGE_05605 [Candidatus Limnocylindria bacterium]